MPPYKNDTFVTYQEYKQFIKENKKWLYIRDIGNKQYPWRKVHFGFWKDTEERRLPWCILTDSCRFLFMEYEGMVGIHVTATNDIFWVAIKKDQLRLNQRKMKVKKII